MKASPKGSPKHVPRRVGRFPEFVRFPRWGGVTIQPEGAIKWLDGEGQGERRMLSELGALTTCAALYAADNSRRSDPQAAIRDAIVVAAATGANAQDRKYLLAMLRREIGGVSW